MRIRAHRPIALILALLIGTDAVLPSLAQADIWAERGRARQYARLPDTSPAKPLPSLSLPPAPRAADRLTASAPAPRRSRVAAALTPRFGQLRLDRGADAGDERLVIHVQDIHRNADAQRAISGALRGALRAGPVRVLALEAGFDTPDFEAERRLADTAARTVAADYLLSKNRITGSVHAVLTHDGAAPRVVGVDDRAAYDRNVEAYRRAGPLKAAVESRLAAWRSRWVAGRKNVNADLARFERAEEAHEAPGGTFGRYVQEVDALCAAFLPAAKRPQTALFLRALALERDIDFEAVEAERARFLAQLVQRLDQGGRERLLTWSVDYREGRIDHGAFYAMLRSLCGGCGVELSLYPRMDRYIRYVLLSSGIDGGELFTELAALREGLADRLARTGSERDRVREGRALALAAKLAAFALTREEWAEYAALGGLPGAGDDLKRELAPFEDFYRAAVERDRLMADRLLAALEKAPGPAIIVTGGFHSSGIDERLRDAGRVVITFTPRVNAVDLGDGSAYLSFFTQEKAPLEKLGQGEKLFLSQPAWTPGVRLTTRVYTAIADLFLRWAALTPTSARERFRAVTGLDVASLTYENGRLSVETEQGPVRVSARFDERGRIAEAEERPARLTLGVRLRRVVTELPRTATLAMPWAKRAAQNLFIREHDPDAARRPADALARIAGFEALFWGTWIAAGFGATAGAAAVLVFGAPALWLVWAPLAAGLLAGTAAHLGIHAAFNIAFPDSPLSMQRVGMPAANPERVRANEEAAQLWANARARAGSVGDTAPGQGSMPELAAAIGLDRIEAYRSGLPEAAGPFTSQRYDLQGATGREIELLRSMIGVDDFELLRDDRGRPVAIIPVRVDDDLPPAARWLGLWPYHFSPPSGLNENALAIWIAEMGRQRRLGAFVAEYLEETGRGDMRRLGSYAMELTDAASMPFVVVSAVGNVPSVEITDIDPDDFQGAAPPWLSDMLYHRYSRPGAPFSTMAIPVFPTVFSPGADNVRQVDVPYHTQVIALATRLPELWRTRGHDGPFEALVMGGGSGVDTWLLTQAWYFARMNGDLPAEAQLSIRVRDINPIAAANVRIALSGTPNNVVVETGTIPEGEFDLVLWNMPSYSPDTAHRAAVAESHPLQLAHDGDDGRVLRAFSKALPRLLRRNGTAIMWNIPSYAPSSAGPVDVVQAAFRTGGGYFEGRPDDTTMDVSITGAPVATTSGATAVHVYRVRHPGAADDTPFTRLSPDDQVRTAQESGLYTSEPIRVPYAAADPVLREIFVALRRAMAERSPDAPTPERIYLGGSVVVGTVLGQRITIPGEINILIDQRGHVAGFDDVDRLEIHVPRDGETIRISVNSESSLSLSRMVVSDGVEGVDRVQSPGNIFLKWSLVTLTEQGIEIRGLDDEAHQNIVNRHLRLSMRRGLLTSIEASYSLIVAIRAMTLSEKPWTMDIGSRALLMRSLRQMNDDSLYSTVAGARSPETPVDAVVDFVRKNIDAAIADRMAAVYAAKRPRAPATWEIWTRGFLGMPAMSREKAVERAPWLETGWTLILFFIPAYALVAGLMSAFGLFDHATATLIAGLVANAIFAGLHWKGIDEEATRPASTRERLARVAWIFIVGAVFHSPFMAGWAFIPAVGALPLAFPVVALIITTMLVLGAAAAVGLHKVYNGAVGRLREAPDTTRRGQLGRALPLATVASNTPAPASLAALEAEFVAMFSGPLVADQSAVANLLTRLRDHDIAANSPATTARLIALLELVDVNRVTNLDGNIFAGTHQFFMSKLDSHVILSLRNHLNGLRPGVQNASRVFADELEDEAALTERLRAEFNLGDDEIDSVMRERARLMAEVSRELSASRFDVLRRHDFPASDYTGETARVQAQKNELSRYLRDRFPDHAAFAAATRALARPITFGLSDRTEAVRLMRAYIWVRFGVFVYLPTGTTELTGLRGGAVAPFGADAAGTGLDATAEQAVHDTLRSSVLPALARIEANKSILSRNYGMRYFIITPSGRGHYSAQKGHVFLNVHDRISFVTYHELGHAALITEWGRTSFAINRTQYEHFLAKYPHLRPSARDRNEGAVQILTRMFRRRAAAFVGADIMPEADRARRVGRSNLGTGMTTDYVYFVPDNDRAPADPVARTIANELMAEGFRLFYQDPVHLAAFDRELFDLMVLFTGRTDAVEMVEESLADRRLLLRGAVFELENRLRISAGALWLPAGTTLADVVRELQRMRAEHAHFFFATGSPASHIVDTVTTYVQATGRDEADQYLLLDEVLAEIVATAGPQAPRDVVEKDYLTQLLSSSMGWREWRPLAAAAWRTVRAYFAPRGGVMEDTPAELRVGQGEFVVAQSRLILTSHAPVCCIVAIRDPKTGLGLLAHMDAENADAAASYEAMMKALIDAGVAPDDVKGAEIRLFGNTRSRRGRTANLIRAGFERVWGRTLGEAEQDFGGDDERSIAFHTGNGNWAELVNVNPAWERPANRTRAPVRAGAGTIDPAGAGRPLVQITTTEAAGAYGRSRAGTATWERWTRGFLGMAPMTRAEAIQRAPFLESAWTLLVFFPLAYLVIAGAMLVVGGYDHGTAALLAGLVANTIFAALHALRASTIDSRLYEWFDMKTPGSLLSRTARAMKLDEARIIGEPEPFEDALVYTIEPRSPGLFAMAMRELGVNVRRARLLVRNGRPVALMPELNSSVRERLAEIDRLVRARPNSDEAAWQDLDYSLRHEQLRYIDFSALLSQPEGFGDAAYWQSYFSETEPSRELVKTYIKAQGFSDFFRYIRSADHGKVFNAVVEVDMKEGVVVPKPVGSLSWKRMLDRRASGRLSADEEQVLIPLLPLVYSPAAEIADEDAGYYSRVTRIASTYEESTGQRWTGGKRVLLIGCGSGLDTLVTLMSALRIAGMNETGRNRPYTLADLQAHMKAHRGVPPAWAPIIEARDVNPLAVENTRLLFERLGIAGVVDVRQGTVPERPLVAPYDMILWNMPLHPGDAPRSALLPTESMVQFHDGGTNGIEALKNLAHRLPYLLADDGVGLFWNHSVFDGDGNDIVETKLAGDPGSLRRKFDVSFDAGKDGRQEHAAVVYTVLARADSGGEGTLAKGETERPAADDRLGALALIWLFVAGAVFHAPFVLGVVTLPTLGFLPLSGPLLVLAAAVVSGLALWFGFEWASLSHGVYNNNIERLKKAGETRFARWLPFATWGLAPTVSATTMDAALEAMGLAGRLQEGAAESFEDMEIRTVTARDAADLALLRSELFPAGDRFDVISRAGRVIAVVPALSPRIEEVEAEWTRVGEEKNPHPRPRMDDFPNDRAGFDAAMARHRGWAVEHFKRRNALFNNMPRAYFFLSGLDTDLPAPTAPGAAAAWEAHLDLRRDDRAALQRYLAARPNERLRRLADADREPVSDVVVRLSPAKGTKRAVSLVSALAETDSRDVTPDDEEALVMRLLPTVYSPAAASNNLADEQYYGAVFAAPAEYEQRSGRPVRGGERLLVVGAGSGLDTLALLMAALRRAGMNDPDRRRAYTIADLAGHIRRTGGVPSWAPKLLARDVNPLAIATTRHLFDRLGIGAALETQIGLNVPEAGSQPFDIILWNMPAYPGREPGADDTDAPGLISYWDHGVNGKLALEELARRLPAVLAPGGYGLFWNYTINRPVDPETGQIVPGQLVTPSTPVEDIVAYRLRENPDAKAKGLVVVKASENSFGSAVYTVTAPRAPPTTVATWSFWMGAMSRDEAVAAAPWRETKWTLGFFFIPIYLVLLGTTALLGAPDHLSAAWIAGLVANGLFAGLHWKGIDEDPANPASPLTRLARVSWIFLVGAVFHAPFVLGAALIPALGVMALSMPAVALFILLSLPLVLILGAKWAEFSHRRYNNTVDAMRRHPAGTAGGALGRRLPVATRSNYRAEIEQMERRDVEIAARIFIALPKDEQAVSRAEGLRLGRRLRELAWNGDAVGLDALIDALPRPDGREMRRMLIERRDSTDLQLGTALNAFSFIFTALTGADEAAAGRMMERMREAPLLEVGAGPGLSLVRFLVVDLGFDPDLVFAIDPMLLPHEAARRPTHYRQGRVEEGLPAGLVGRKNVRTILSFFVFNPEIAEPGMLNPEGIPVRLAVESMLSELDPAGAVIVVAAGAKGMSDAAREAFSDVLGREPNVSALNQRFAGVLTRSGAAVYDTSMPATPPTLEQRLRVAEERVRYLEDVAAGRSGNIRTGLAMLERARLELDALAASLDASSNRSAQLSDLLFRLNGARARLGMRSTILPATWSIWTRGFLGFRPMTRQEAVDNAPRLESRVTLLFFFPLTTAAFLLSAWMFGNVDPQAAALLGGVAANLFFALMHWDSIDNYPGLPERARSRVARVVWLFVMGAVFHAPFILGMMMLTSMALSGAAALAALIATPVLLGIALIWAEQSHGVYNVMVDGMRRHPSNTLLGRLGRMFPVATWSRAGSDADGQAEILAANLVDRALALPPVVNLGLENGDRPLAPSRMSAADRRAVVDAVAARARALPEAGRPSWPDVQNRLRDLFGDRDNDVLARAGDKDLVIPVDAANIGFVEALLAELSRRGAKNTVRLILPEGAAGAAWKARLDTAGLLIDWRTAPVSRADGRRSIVDLGALEAEINRFARSRAERANLAVLLPGGALFEGGGLAADTLLRDVEVRMIESILEGLGAVTTIGALRDLDRISRLVGASA